MPDLTVLPKLAPFDRWQIPEEFRFAHAVAFSFLDQMSALVHGIEEAGQFKLELTPEESLEIRGLRGGELWTWLMSNGHEGHVKATTYREITLAVLADSCHFLYESLVTVAKGKNAVSFALLRKPFKDNLFVLEWLLVDPEGFFEAFHGDVASAYAIDRISKARKLEIIAGVQGHLPDAMFNAEFMYELRYSKKHFYSLEHLWQKATHLVTTVEELATEAGNFNFVFSGRSEQQDQWRTYYQVVPSLSLYMLHVAEAVTGEMLSWNEKRQEWRNMLRRVAFARHVQEFGTISPEGSWDDLNELLNELDVTCDKCDTQIPLDEPNIDRLWSAAELACVSCKAIHDVWGALFPEEVKDSGYVG